MDNLNNFIQSVRFTAEVTVIVYNALLKAGLSEDVAVTLTAKMIGEFVKADGNKQKENGQ